MKKFSITSVFLTIFCVINSFSQINHNFAPITKDEFVPPVMSSGSPIPAGTRYPSAAGFMRNDSAWIFIMGGLLDGNIITANCYRYNVRTDTWESIPPLPLGAVWIGAGVSVSNKIYNLGGTTTLALNQAQSWVQVYNTSTGTWSTAANMIYGRTFLAAAAYQDSLIYAAGGWGYPGGAAYNDVSLYNIHSNQWRSASNMPAPRCGGVLAISSDTIVYICGGYDWVNPAARNTVFRGVISQIDRSIITWDSLGAVYPPGNRSSIYGGNWGSKGVVVSGGYSYQQSSATNECYVYSPGANTWTQQPNLLSNRTDHGAATIHMGNIWKFVNVTGTSNRSGTNLTTVNILTDSFYTIVGIQPIVNNSPNGFLLYQNYPNPFNPRTVISFQSSMSNNVRLLVYDVLGNEVKTLINEKLNPGTYQVEFDGTNYPSGIYFYKLSAGSFTDTKRMVLIK